VIVVLSLSFNKGVAAMKWGILLLLVSNLGCSKPEVKANAETTWPENMQKLAATFRDLIPYVYNREAFEDPKNKKIILEKIQNFNKASHVIPIEKAQQILGEDPLVNVSIKGLDTEVQSALTTFERGNYRYSRHLLQHSLNYCFACHTRNQSGPRYDFWDFSDPRADDMNVIQKSKIMVATRQFEKAKETLKSTLMSGKKEGDNPYLQEQAIKQFLAVVVRAEKSPEEGYQFVNGLINRVELPVYLSKNLQSWEKSFVQWMGELKSKKKSTNFLEDAKKLVKVSNLLHSGEDSDSKYVDYLRASSLLHDSLMNPKNKTTKAESLYLLGVVYELLGDSGFWELPDVYFEACVRELPNSNTAKSCYRKYEQNIVVGYSGSAGIFIPSDERMKLNELKKLAGY